MIKPHQTAFQKNYKLFVLSSLTTSSKVCRPLWLMADDHTKMVAPPNQPGRCLARGS